MERSCRVIDGARRVDVNTMVEPSALKDGSLFWIGIGFPSGMLVKVSRLSPWSSGTVPVAA